jgi:hypothetical protein
MTVSHPTTWRKWAAAAVALGVLACGVALLDDDALSWPLAARAVLAFAIGVLAAAVWWALSWLAGYGVKPP